MKTIETLRIAIAVHQIRADATVVVPRALIEEAVLAAVHKMLARLPDATTIGIPQVVDGQLVRVEKQLRFDEAPTHSGQLAVDIVDVDGQLVAVPLE